MAMLHGMDPRSILECDDPITQVVLEQVIQYAVDVAGKEREDQANRIASAVSQLFRQ